MVTPSPPPAPHTNLYPQILLLGDSITEQSANPTLSTFQSRLQTLYIRRLDIINRGLSGYNTAHARHILPSLIPSPSQATLKLLVIFFGANDAATLTYKSPQHVSIPDYKANLHAMLGDQTVKAHGERLPVLLVTPPMCDERQMADSGFGAGGRLVSVTAQYAEAVREVAREAKTQNLNVVCCDLWAKMLDCVREDAGSSDLLPGDVKAPVNAKLQGLFRDGLHFTSKGYELMFEAVTEAIGANWEELRPENLKAVFPPWGDAPKWAGGEAERRGAEEI